MEDFIIIHNPRCSKSREALAILKERGIEPRIVEYLKSGLSKDFLKHVIDSLGTSSSALLRTKEEEFDQLDIDSEDSEQVIESILNHPILLERPIVIKGKKAVIGRPPENVLKLLDRSSAT